MFTALHRYIYWIILIIFIGRSSKNTRVETKAACPSMQIEQERAISWRKAKGPSRLSFFTALSLSSSALISLRPTYDLVRNDGPLWTLKIKIKQNKNTQAY